MGAGLFEDRVDDGEVEGAAGWLHLLPVDGDFEGVEAERFGGGPDGVEARGPAAGVVDLRAEEEVGCAVDHECGAAVVLDELRDLLRGASEVVARGAACGGRRSLH